MIRKILFNMIALTTLIGTGCSITEDDLIKAGKEGNGELLLKVIRDRIDLPEENNLVQMAITQMTKYQLVHELAKLENMLNDSLYMKFRSYLIKQYILNGSEIQNLGYFIDYYFDSFNEDSKELILIQDSSKVCDYVKSRIQETLTFGNDRTSVDQLIYLLDIGKFLKTAQLMKLRKKVNNIRLVQSQLSEVESTISSQESALTEYEGQLIKAQERIERLNLENRVYTEEVSIMGLPLNYEAVIQQTLQAFKDDNHSKKVSDYISEMVRSGNYTHDLLITHRLLGQRNSYEYNEVTFIRTGEREIRLNNGRYETWRVYTELTNYDLELREALKSNPNIISKLKNAIMVNKKSVNTYNETTNQLISSIHFTK